MHMFINSQALSKSTTKRLSDAVVEEKENVSKDICFLCLFHKLKQMLFIK